MEEINPIYCCVFNNFLFKDHNFFFVPKTLHAVFDFSMIVFGLDVVKFFHAAKDNK